MLLPTQATLMHFSAPETLHTNKRRRPITQSLPINKCLIFSDLKFAIYKFSPYLLYKLYAIIAKKLDIRKPIINNYSFIQQYNIITKHNMYIVLNEKAASADMNLHTHGNRFCRFLPLLIL